MLAEMAQDLQEVFTEHNGATAFEFKYDGARIQIHRKRDQVRIFSRRLTDVTDSLPDVVQVSKDRIKGTEYLIEGEVVAIGEDQKPLPFQDLMRRFRRVHVPSRATRVRDLQGKGGPKLKAPAGYPGPMHSEGWRREGTRRQGCCLY